MVPNDYTSESPGPYWSNPPFFIFDIRALWRSGLSAREPECQKLKNGGLDQYGPERFGRLILLQSEKCGTERVNVHDVCYEEKNYTDGDDTLRYTDHECARQTGFRLQDDLPCVSSGTLNPTHSLTGQADGRT